MKLNYDNNNERIRCEILMNHLVPARERLGQWLMAFKSQHGLTYKGMGSITGCVYTTLVDIAKGTNKRILSQDVIDRLYLRYEDITNMEREMLKFVRAEAEGVRSMPWEIIYAYVSCPEKIKKYCDKVARNMLNVKSLIKAKNSNIGEKK